MEILGTYFIIYYDKTAKKFKVKNEEQYNKFIDIIRMSCPIHEIRFIPKNSIFSL